MDAFLSTLVTAVATLLGILLAAITAYFVFQRERLADFSKEKFDEILAIRDLLQPLRNTGFPIEMIMPSRFMEKWRFDHRTKPRADTLRPLRSAIDTRLDFSLKVEDDFRKGGDRYLDQPWRGRAYYLLLREAAYQMAPQFEPARPEQGTFPTFPVEVGFEEWREVFRKLDEATRDSVGSRDRAIKDFKTFNVEILTNAEALFLSWIHRFSDTVESIRARLSKIDKLEHSFKNHSYALNTWQVASLYLFCIVSFVSGVVIPLAWLAQPSVSKGAIWAPTVWITALSATLLAFAVFGFGVFRSAKPPDKRGEYVDLQWRRPLRAEMEQADAKFDDYGPLDLDFSYEARSSGDLKGVLLDALSSYVGSAEDYNANVAKFDRMVVELFRSHFLGAVSGIQATCGLSTHGVLRPNKIAEIIAKLRDKPDSAFDIFTLSRKGRGSDPALFVASVASHTEEDLRAKLETIAQIVSGDPVTADLERTHRLVSEVRKTLKNHLPEARR